MQSGELVNELHKHDLHMLIGSESERVRNGITQRFELFLLMSEHPAVLGQAGVPVILLVHLAGNLDNWDPRVVDGIAAKHRVITFDNRGVGASTGKTPETIQAMAKDAVTSSAR